MCIEREGLTTIFLPLFRDTHRLTAGLGRPFASPAALGGLEDFYRLRLTWLRGVGGTCEAMHMHVRLYYIPHVNRLVERNDILILKSLCLNRL